MIKKIGIILFILLGIVIALYMAFFREKNIEILPTPTPSPQIAVKQDTAKILTGSEQEKIHISPTQTGTKTEDVIWSQTGITVSINTNGSPTRNMTPEELKIFQQKIQKK